MPAPTHDYWYENAPGTDLRQGDILRDLVVLWWPQELPVLEGVPPDGEVSVKPQWDRGDWIVMSASCDVDNPSRYPHALLGRVIAATPSNFGITDRKEFAKRLEVVRKGLDASKFLLAEFPAAAPPFPLSMVTYRVHVTMPIQYLRRSCIGRCLRLRHPIREMFGAWVGQNVSRVGPENYALIPPSGVTTWPDDTLRANED